MPTLRSKYDLKQFEETLKNFVKRFEFDEARFKGDNGYYTISFRRSNGILEKIVVRFSGSNCYFSMTIEPKCYLDGNITRISYYGKLTDIQNFINKLMADVKPKAEEELINLLKFIGGGLDDSNRKEASIGILQEA
ncbi:MAG: hypothetical protein QXT67_04910 [Candidatus Bathyarchaeia archaeon]